MLKAIDKRDINKYVIKFYIEELIYILYQIFLKKDSKIFLNKYNELLNKIQDEYIREHEYLKKIYKDLNLIKNFNIYIVNKDNNNNEKVIGVIDNIAFSKILKLIDYLISINNEELKDINVFKNYIIKELSKFKIIDINFYNLLMDNKNLNIFDIYNTMRNKYDFIPVLKYNKKNNLIEFIGEISYSTMLKIIYELFLKDHDFNNKIFNFHMFDIIKENSEIFEDVPLSIFTINVENINYLKSFYGYEEYTRTLEKIIDLIIYNLRKIDYIFYNKENNTFIILLVNTNKAIANKVRNRIEEKLLAEKDNITNLLELEFNFSNILNTIEDNITVENAYFQLTR